MKPSKHKMIADLKVVALTKWASVETAEAISAAVSKSKAILYRRATLKEIQHS